LLKQDKPEAFVISTVERHIVREIETPANAGLGMKRLALKAGSLMRETLGAFCRAYSAIHAVPQELPGDTAPGAS
jgi:GDP-D-mannose dehydratase